MHNDEFPIPPRDAHNETLVGHVSPPDWVNPEPAGNYNLVVVGAGPAGLIAAAGAAGLGGKVALVERHLMGGDCLNVGCVPSKALLAASRVAHSARHAGEFGIEIEGEIRVDFAAVMERMRRLRAGVSGVDSAKRYTEELGVDVFLGNGVFEDERTLQVGEKRLGFSRALVSTGARAAKLPIPGLWETGALTNETVFGLTELPRRLAVIGAGPIGCELSQAFARFGAKVQLFEAGTKILPREDEDAARIVRQSLERDGVEVICGANLREVSGVGEAKRIALGEGGPGEGFVEVDEILVGAGRAPNVEGMGLEAAGVAFDQSGIQVDDRLQTTNSRIYAAGDCAMKHKFTHMADAAARIVLRNALFRGREKLSALTVPWCTYTEPEIAHVGLYEHEAEEQGIEVETFRQDFEHLDRAVLEGAGEGLVKVHVKKGSDEILGATLVAPHAGEMISELTLAMTGKLGLGGIYGTIHPYPTVAEAIKKVSEAHNRTRLTPFVGRLFRWWMAWQR